MSDKDAINAIIERIPKLTYDDLKRLAATDLTKGKEAYRAWLHGSRGRHFGPWEERDRLAAGLQRQIREKFLSNTSWGIFENEDNGAAWQARDVIVLTIFALVWWDDLAQTEREALTESWLSFCASTTEVSP